MNGKILKSAFKNSWTNPTNNSVFNYHDLEVESDGVKYVGTIGCKDVMPEWITEGKDFEFTFDAEKKKFTRIQAQSGGNKFGGGGGGFKPNEQQWIAMQKSISAQSCLNSAVEFAKGKDVKGADVIKIAEAFYQFVISKSDFK
jgi:hypothetical protein